MVSKTLLALVLSAVSLTGVEARACIKRSSSLSLPDLPSPTSSILSTPTPIVSLSTPASSDLVSTPSTEASPISETPSSTILATTPSTDLSDVPATPIITPSTDASSTTPVITPSTDLPATTPAFTSSAIASSTTPEVASSTPEVASSTPEVASSTPEVASSTPEVASSTAVSSTIASTTLVTSTTSAAPVCTPSNLVSNPSFEQGLNSWINFNGGVASSSGAVTAKDGNSYFLAALTGSNNFISVRQELQMEIGKTYDVKAYYSLGAHQNFGSGGCNLQLTMGGDLQGSEITSTPTTVGQWSLFERTYVATDTSVLLRYVFTCSGVTSVDGLLDLITVPSACPTIPAATTSIVTVP